jgi:hypothetical protein
MSLFDEVRVEYPLPDGFDPQGRLFQTEDTPTQWGTLYVLTAEGTLRHEASGERLVHHGLLTVYASNICVAGPWGVVTDDTDPPWFAGYAGFFGHGRLVWIEGQRTWKTDRPQLFKAVWRWCHAAYRRKQMHA